MSDSKVFQPTSINELLRTYQQYPKALILAGSTAIAREQKGDGPFELPDMVLHISKIPELQRISRTERYFEIGSCVPISRILKVGQHVLPKVFTHALHNIAHPAIRNMGTLGGNLGHQPRRLNTFGPLTILDARVELRKFGSSRWVQVPRLFTKAGEPALEPGEFISRVRIPFVDWNLQFYQRIGDPFTKPKSSLTFSALTAVEKGEITDFRVVFTFLGRSILRDRELETLISGKKVPLSERIRTEARSLFRSSLMDLPGEVTLFQKQRALRLLQWYLSALHEPTSEVFY
ncbi:MAG: FAD binding domain-containing protein [Spirochaetia bacterium]